MVEGIVGAIVGLFEGITSIPFGKELIVFLISLMPILELRGGLIAAALLDLNLLWAVFSEIPSFISFILCS